MTYPASSTSKQPMSNMFITTPFDGLYSVFPGVEKIKKFLDLAKNDMSRERSEKDERNKTKNSADLLDDQYKKHMVSSFCVPSDTYIHECYREDMKGTDLYCDREKSPIGYTKLRPAVEKRWPNSLILEGGECYLKQLIFKRESPFSETKIAFRCMIPDEALEWFERDRDCNWPSEEFITKMKADYTCLVSSVISSNDTFANSQTTEWRFAFDIMELDLIQDEVTEDQRKVFGIFQQLVQHVFPTGPIKYSHLKQVFFYTCERRRKDDWIDNPVDCVLSMLDMLLNGVRRLFLPYYFCIEFNCFDQLDTNGFKTCIDKLELLISYPFLLLFLTLYEHKIKIFCSKIFDEVIEDIQRYSFDKDEKKSLDECFVPMTVQGVSDLASSRYFKSAFNASKTAVMHLQRMTGVCCSITLNDFLSLVLFSTADRYRWMFALYLDQQLDSSYVRTVTDASKPTVSLFQFFGPKLKDCLKTYDNGDIRVPESLTQTAQLLTFIIDMESLLAEEMGVGGDIIGPCLLYFTDRYFDSIFKSFYSCTETEKTIKMSQIKILLNTIKIHIYNSTLQSEMAIIGRLRDLIDRELGPLD